jgi:hypothetical protein
MATIGTFTKTENGFTGTVKTLSLNVKTVKFVPAEGDSERGPDFRIFAGATDYAKRGVMRSGVVRVQVFRGFRARRAPHNPEGRAATARRANRRGSGRSA